MDMPATDTRWIIISPSVYVDIINEGHAVRYKDSNLFYFQESKDG